MSGIDQYAKLALHCNGANGSTTVTDSSGSAHTQTVHGSCQISTAQSKFGGASLKFVASTSDWLEVSNSSDFDFGNGDFTIDYWIYQTSSTGHAAHVSRTRAATWTPFILGYGGSAVYMSSNGTSWDIASNKSMGSAILNTWSHIEISREGNTFRIFRDGTQTDTWTSSLSFPAGGAALALGSAQNGAYMDGYIDEFRVSKGICRHTSNFTPPSSEYSTSYSPATISGTPPLTIVANNNSYIDIIDDSGVPCDHYQLEFIHVVSDIETPPNAQSGALLTAYISTDEGTSFDTGPYYNNTGIVNFPGETNPTYMPPFPLGLPQTLNMGCRLSIDTGDAATYGATGVADIYNAGGHTQYTSKSVKGAIGGNSNDTNANTSAAFFPSNGSSPFWWACQVDYAGHYDGDAGQRPNAFRLKMDGGGNTSAIIESGTFKLRRMD